MPGFPAYLLCLLPFAHAGTNNQKLTGLQKLSQKLNQASSSVGRKLQGGGDVSYVCKVHTDFLPDKMISLQPFGAPTGTPDDTCKGLMEKPLFDNNGVGADFSSANDCSSYSNDLKTTIKQVATSGCCGENGISTCSDPAAAKCSDISDTLAWCKMADSNKFTNGLISDSNGIPVVGLMCKADPCIPADDGATCCEDTSGGTNGECSLSGCPDSSHACFTDQNDPCYQQCADHCTNSGGTNNGGTNNGPPELYCGHGTVYDYNNKHCVLNFQNFIDRCKNEPHLPMCGHQANTASCGSASHTDENENCNSVLHRKNLQCPANTKPREEHDWHQPFGNDWDGHSTEEITRECCQGPPCSDWQGICPDGKMKVDWHRPANGLNEAECCHHNCHTTMARHGLVCPTGRTARSEHDFHMPWGNDWDSHSSDEITRECCPENCHSVMTIKGLTCDGGGKLRGP